MECVATCQIGALVIKPGKAVRCADGGSAQLGAWFQFLDGEGEVTQGLAWSSSDTGVAVVDSNGLVTTVGRGVAVISAEWHYYEAYMELAVVAGVDCCAQVQTQAAVLIDNSISMGAKFGDGYGTKLDAAKAIARGLADGLQSKDQQAIISFHEAPYTQQEMGSDSEGIKQAIDDIEQTDRLTDLASALAGALRLLQGTEQLEGASPPFVPPPLTYLEYSNLY